MEVYWLCHGLPFKQKKTEGKNNPPALSWSSSTSPAALETGRFATIKGASRGVTAIRNFFLVKVCYPWWSFTWRNFDVSNLHLPIFVYHVLVLVHGQSLDTAMQSIEVSLWTITNPKAHRKPFNKQDKMDRMQQLVTNPATKKKSTGLLYDVSNQFLLPPPETKVGGQVPNCCSNPLD